MKNFAFNMQERSKISESKWQKSPPIPIVFQGQESQRYKVYFTNHQEPENLNNEFKLKLKQPKKTLAKADIIHGFFKESLTQDLHVYTITAKVQLNCRSKTLPETHFVRWWNIN